MTTKVTREQALALLKKYNQEPFHIQHACTVEAVMRWFAEELGHGDPDFWGLCGLLHDVDFEKYPDEHCKKAPELLAEIDRIGSATDFGGVPLFSQAANILAGHPRSRIKIMRLPCRLAPQRQRP